MIALLPALAQAACTVFWALGDPGTVSLPDGPRTDVAVVVKGERIAAVGTPAELSLTGASWEGEACAEVDLSGRWLTPGLVAVGTAIGVTEISLEDATTDHDAGSEDPIRAAFRMSEAYNPRSTLIPIARTGGVTSTVILPSGGLVSGQAAWADLAGATQAQAVVAPSVGVVTHLGLESKAEALLRLRELLDDARVYLADPKAFEQNRSRPLSASRLDLEALGPVLRGEQPLVVGADRASDIEAVLRLGAEQKIRLVIVGGAEGWLVSADLAAAKVPVVLDPLVYGPGSFDEIFARPDNPALLVAAGVPVMLSAFSSHNARTTPQMAGNAVRGGLDHTAALAAVTSVPAEAFGLADRGRIVVGAVASLVVWHSLAPGWPVDPFETTTAPERVFVRGTEPPTGTRQTDLRDRYLTLPGQPPPLSLP